MKRKIEARVIEVAKYITESEDTLRGTAKIFGYSKSTIHGDMIRSLPLLDATLFNQVQSILIAHKNERARRGGEATRLRYQRMK